MSETTTEKTYVFPENNNNSALCSGMMMYSVLPMGRYGVQGERYPLG